MGKLGKYYFKYLFAISTSSIYYFYCQLWGFSSNSYKIIVIYSKLNKTINAFMPFSFSTSPSLYLTCFFLSFLLFRILSTNSQFQMTIFRCFAFEILSCILPNQRTFWCAWKTVHYICREFRDGDAALENRNCRLSESNHVFSSACLILWKQGRLLLLLLLHRTKHHRRKKNVKTTATANNYD